MQGDYVCQRFTSKERDNESGLDYFNARYYTSSLGRFTSTDPLSGEAKQPQTWNSYTYVLNNPLKFVDPDGLRYVQRTLANGKIQYAWCATEECYNTAIDSSRKDYAGWTAVSFDETQSFAYRIRGVGGDLYDTYVLNPDGTHGCISCGSMSTDWNAQFAIGGLIRGLAGAIGRGLFGLFARQAATTASGEVVGLYGKVSTEVLENAAASNGATVQVFTRLTQSPQAERALSVATGEGAEALVNAARSEGQVYAAQIPRALIDQMKRSGLVIESKTQMGNATATELRFLPQATKFITKFFNEQK